MLRMLAQRRARRYAHARRSRRRVPESTLLTAALRQLGKALAQIIRSHDRGDVDACPEFDEQRLDGDRHVGDVFEIEDDKRRAPACAATATTCGSWSPGP